MECLVHRRALFATFFAVRFTAFSQEFRAAFGGSVTDPSA